MCRFVIPHSSVEGLDLHDVTILQVEVISEFHAGCLQDRSGRMTSAALVCIGAKNKRTLLQYQTGHAVDRNAATVFLSLQPNDSSGQRVRLIELDIAGARKQFHFSLAKAKPRPNRFVPSTRG
jgi:hypothetical protein